MLKPYPAMQALYLETRSLHASWALSLVEKSMHSSRAAFSSLQTQQGCPMFSQNSAAKMVVARHRRTFGFAAAAEVPVDLRSAPRLAEVAGAADHCQ